MLTDLGRGEHGCDGWTMAMEGFPFPDSILNSQTVIVTAIKTLIIFFKKIPKSI